MIQYVCVFLCVCVVCVRVFVLMSSVSRYSIVCYVTAPYVCMYVCVCMCVFVCVHVCMRVYVCACVSPDVVPSLVTAW